MKVALPAALGFVLVAQVLAMDSSSTRLDELTTLLNSAKYSEAEDGARALLAEVEKASGTQSVEAAHVLDVLVESLWRGGKARDPETRGLAERSLTLKQNVLDDDDPDVATSLSNLALLLGLTGEYAGARPLYERALEIRERAFGPDHTQVAASLNGLATLLKTTGDYAASRPLYERALAIQEKALGPDHPGVASSLHNLASLLRETGDYGAARPLFERALEIREKAFGPDHPEVAVALNGLAVLFRVTGDYAAARPLYERALAIQEHAVGPDHPNVAVGANNLANLLWDAGDYTAARRLYERAVVIWEKTAGPGHPKVASGLDGLARVLKKTGDYPAARSLFERALAVREKAYGPNHPEIASSLNNLANLLQITGDYVAARPLYERALAILEKTVGPEHLDVAVYLNGLAMLQHTTGDYAAARSSYERALAILEKAVGPDSPDLAYSLNGLAELIDTTGEHDAARRLCERALAIQRKSLELDHPEVAVSLVILARFEATQGEMIDALNHALEAERIARNHLRLTGRALSERQALQYAAVRMSGLDLALTLSGRGLDPTSCRRAFDELVRSRAVVLDVMAARHRGVTGANDPGVVRLAEVLSVTRVRLANILVRGIGNDEPEAYRKLLDDTREEKEKAERALAEASTSFAQEMSRVRFGLDDVATNLPEGSALVAFAEYNRIDLTAKSPTKIEAVSPDRSRSSPFYLAFVLLAGERDPLVIEIGAAKTIDATVAQWKEEASRGLLRVGRSPEQSEAAYREVGSTLRRAVWDPLIPALRDVDRVFVVPDGSLNLVNLAALPLEDGGYLVERGPLLHSFSAERDLVPSSDVSRGQSLFAVGAPDYDATAMFASLRTGKEIRADEVPPEDATPIMIASADTYRGQHSNRDAFSSMKFRPLPATGKEAEEIVSLWEEYAREDSSGHGEPVELRDAAASETALKQLAPGHRVLHLATHGFFLGSGGDPALATGRGIGSLKETPITSSVGTTSSATEENPLLFSGLVLAGANHRSAAGENEDDGILTAEEIASLDLSGVEWAVLSACETGVGDIRVGEGVFGLRRAFQVAGAGTLIMSLWSVDDESTRSWMKSLYEARLIDRLDTAESVRRASLEVLREHRARKQSTHPFYWAAFVAAGDWR